MAWQGYYILFDTEDEFNSIMAAIAEHDAKENLDSAQMVHRAEPLTGGQVIVFGNSGDRAETTSFFTAKGFVVHNYVHAVDKNLWKPGSVRNA